MNILNKLKTINKKWIYLLVSLIIIAIIAAVIGGIYCDNLEKNYKESHYWLSSPVYADLLYLENTDTLKVTPEQAKTILPLLEQIPAAEPALRMEIAKKIYLELTPQQYQTLLSNSGKLMYLSDNHSDKEKYDGENSYREDHFGKGNEKYDSIREQVLPDIVIKLLKTRSVQ